MSIRAPILVAVAATALLAADAADCPAAHNGKLIWDDGVRMMEDKPRARK